MSLLWPTGLLALAGVLVPLLIHLVRRSESAVVVFAALRWLDERARPRRRLRFERPWLLALRILLIVLLALLLARPQFTAWPQARGWLLVAPGAEVAEELADTGALERRWLAPGFPPLSEPMPAAFETASLLREADTRLPPSARLRVIVPAELGGLDGERPRLSREVDWRVVAGHSPVVEPPPAPAWRMAIRYEPGRENELRYLRAALAAWRRNGDDAATTQADIAALDAAGEAPAVDADRLIWLSERPLPESVGRWLEAGGTVLRVAAGADPAAAGGTVLWRNPDTGAALSARGVGQGRALHLDAKLEPARLPQLLEADFPERLRAWLASPPPAPARAPGAAHAPRAGAAPPAPPPRPLHNPLALLIALGFVLERWLTSRRMP